MIEIHQLIQAFLISFAVGALIGVEREHSHTGMERFGGLRTFIFISLLGTLSALLAEMYTYLIIVVSLLGVVMIVCFGYLAMVYVKKDVGLVNETASFITFILGVMCYHIEFQQIAVILAIVITTLLATKRMTHEFAHKLKDIEVLDTLKFAVITLIVLPLIPDKEIILYGNLSLNPYMVWLMVVLICGISFIGYILMKIFGADRGIGMTGIIGGLVSSTAVTTTMAEKTKQSNLILKACVFATIIASAVMFIRILVVVAVVNNALLEPILLPLLAMAGTGILISVIIWSRKSRIKPEMDKTEVELKSPFSIIPALKFGLFFALVLIAAKAANMWFGESG
ncbi:MAG: hypothetical protein CVT90_01935, partial [Candidatus Altiarchaeales archaeon HGW-Altiarchaeales-3]